MAAEAPMAGTPTHTGHIVVHIHRRVPYPDADLGCCTSVIGVLFLVQSLGALLGAVNSDDALVEEILGRVTN